MVTSLEEGNEGIEYITVNGLRIIAIMLFSIVTLFITVGFCLQCCLVLVNLTFHEVINWKDIWYLKTFSEGIIKNPFFMGVLRNIGYFCCGNASGEITGWELPPSNVDNEMDPHS